MLEDRAKARAIDAYSEHRSRGRIAEERGNFPDALEHFRKAHELRPLLEEAQTNYVFALIALEDWQTAKAQARAVLEHHVWLGSDLLGSVLSKEVRTRKPRATSSWPWVEALEEESEAERASIRDVARTLEKVLLDPEQASRDEGGSRGPHVAADDDWARVARLYTIAGDPAGASRALFHVRDSRSSNVRVARALMLLQTRSKPTKEDLSNALFELGMDSRNGRPRATSFARLGRAWEQAGAFTTAKRCFETAARPYSEGYLGKRAEEAAKRLQGADLRPPSHYGAPEDGYCTPSTRVESSSADANDETRHSVTPAPSEP